MTALAGMPHSAKEKPHRMMPASQQPERHHHDKGEHHCGSRDQDAEHRTDCTDQYGEQRDAQRDGEQHQHDQQPRGNAAPAAPGFA